MNFVVGFILLVNGGIEEETFWFFKNILEKTPSSTEMDELKFEGLARFYSEGFRLLTQYFSIFHEIFQAFLPELKAHFDKEGIPDILWL
jgi:Rab-GTPase-TBC domain